MPAAVPLIYAPEEEAKPVAGLARAGALALGLGCLCVLVVATQLRPSPRGLGSHTSLGLPACQFLSQTGLPCPGCGMTTSFAWFVRGNLLASAYVQPMGMFLAASACCCFWAGLYIALTGRPIYRILSLVPGRYQVVPLLSLAVLAWAWKIVLHLSGIDGWG